MVKWYLATYQNGIFLSDLDLIESTGDYVYKLKNPIESTKSPVKSDWLRIRITDNKVEKWVTDNGNSSWTQDTSLTGLVNNSTCWVYGSPYAYYTIITNSQVYYLESFSNNENEGTRIITGKDINDSDVTINDLTTITAVTIGPSVTEIGDHAFYGCTSLASVTIPDSVTSIGDAAFRECSSLASVTIGDSVTSIGTAAFQLCSSLASLTIGDSVTSIGDAAFSRCSSLGSTEHPLIIPDSVTSIGYKAFDSNTTITLESGIELTSFPGISNVSSLDTNDFTTTTNGLIINEHTKALLGVINTISGSITIPDNVTSIGYSAFSNSEVLTTVTFGETSTLETIGDYAFYQCSKLASVTIPDSVTEIGDGAFYQCSTLESVTFGENSTLNTIGDLAFYKCTSLGSTEHPLIIPDSVTEIGGSVFRECSSLASVTFGENSTLNTIGDKAFYQCTNLTSVTIPDSVTEIGYSAFDQCSTLASVTFGENSTLNTIGDLAFYKCTSLTSVTIPDSVTEIGVQAFYGCSSLASVTFGENSTLETIGDAAFYGCSKLATLIIPDSVETIENNAFKNINSNNPTEAKITISQNTVRSLMDDDTLPYTYTSGNEYTGQSFFSSSTNVTLNVT